MMPDHLPELAGPDQIAHAADLLRDGGLVAFPTETVYGLGADALNPAAVASVFLIKGRPPTNPLIVHVTGVDMVAPLVRNLPDRAVRLMRAFWPGPLSIVLPKSQLVPDIVTAGGPNVALRCPDHPIALALLFAFGKPLVGPSANTSGRISPTAADHVRQSFTTDQVYTLDGGTCGTGIESTVVSLIGDRTVILRPGVIGSHAISQVLHEDVLDSTITAPINSRQDAPGQLASHYAPHARAILFKDWHDLDGIIDMTDGPVIVLTHSLLAEHNHTRYQLIELSPDPREYAAQLYASLRRADAFNPALIAIHHPPVPGPGETDPESAAIWRAVLDRLSRATAHG